MSDIDIEPFMEKHADAFFYLPYALTHRAIGETDGGPASLFECDFSGYGSGLANAGANRIAEAVLAHYPIDEVVDRLAAIEVPEIAQRFETVEQMTSASIPSIAREVVDLWHGALKKAFHEVPYAHVQIDASSHSSVRAVEKYLKYEHTQSDEYQGHPHPSPRGM